MRKTPALLAGLLATGALAGTAIAQSTPSHTTQARVSPSNAGTSSDPANVSLRLDISNNRDAGTTADRIIIDLPRGLKMNPRGFRVCSESTITDRGPNACPRQSRLGTGTAQAVLNPNAASDNDPNTNPSNLTFRNTFFVGGRNFVNIYLVQSPGDVRAVLKGTISNSGRRLSIAIPEDLQQPAPGVYSALTDITTTLKGTSTGSRSTRHGFFELSRCSGGSLRVGTRITYVNNPNPPSSPSSRASDSVRCSR